jgi:hypothetical protein
VAKLLLDKNPHQILDNNLEKILLEFSEKSPNVILCKKPFLKTGFLNRLIADVDFPVIFFDVDFLYSGYVNSGLVKKAKNITIFCISKENIENNLKKIIELISKEKSLLVIDSLNGFYNMFDEVESARFVNAAIMLLSSIARITKSLVIVAGMGTKNEDGEWILSPSGRHFIQSQNTTRFFLSMDDSRLVLKTIDRNPVQSFEMEK